MFRSAARPARKVPGKTAIESVIAQAANYGKAADAVPAIFVPDLMDVYRRRIAEQGCNGAVCRRQHHPVRAGWPILIVLQQRS